MQTDDVALVLCQPATVNTDFLGGCVVQANLNQYVDVHIHTHRTFITPTPGCEAAGVKSAQYRCSHKPSSIWWTAHTIRPNQQHGIVQHSRLPVWCNTQHQDQRATHSQPQKIKTKQLLHAWLHLISLLQATSTRSKPHTSHIFIRKRRTAQAAAAAAAGQTSRRRHTTAAAACSCILACI